MELVFFLSVEIDLVFAHVFGCAEGGGAVLGHEVVVVHGDVADEIEGPSLVGTPGDVGLVVEVTGFVLTFFVHRAEQVGGGFIANAVNHREFFVAESYVAVDSEHAG